MKVARSDRLTALQQAITGYYRKGRRDLPWRRTRDPYRILVSEVMLQQTQVERVIPKYHAFLERFPTLAALAHAKLADVLRAWVGLGYNSRAVRLWQCARLILRRHAGRFPRAEAALRHLPGIGKYTAAALASFAFRQSTAAVDVNVRRVLTRALRGEDAISARALARIANEALPGHTVSADWTQALMDVGALFCRPNPKCERCPARSACRYASLSAKNRLARQRAAISRPQETFAGSTRFYRGRIIRLLTTSPSMSMLQLGMQVKEGFDLSDRPWLHSILHALERDGLVKIRGAQRVSLP